MYVRNCLLLLWICLLISLAVVIRADGDEDESEGNLSRTVLVPSLEGHCQMEGKVTSCSGFQFESEDEKATFDLPTEVRIAEDGTTYEVGDEMPSRTLIFENCTFTNFPLRLFYTLEVSELDMRSCGIRFIYWENFSIGADNLVILLLSDNKLEMLPMGTFRGAGNLEFLFLNRNKLSKLHAGAFENLKKLQYLDLTENRLEDLPGGIFSELKSLRHVGLAHNQLTIIESDLFGQNPGLLSVAMQNNRLREVGEYAFRSKGRDHQIQYVDLSNNPQLTVLLLNINATNLTVRNCSLDRVNLYGSVTNVDLSDNRVRELYFPASEALEHLVLRNNSLVQLASLSRVPKLRHLDVADNPHLGQLPQGWQTPELQMLVLRNTGQVEVPLEALQGMPNLQKLDISFNNLTEIDPSTFPTLTQLTHFFIHGNNWNCFSLRVIMDVLIRGNGITYTIDDYNPNFPGEYFHGIACMYRLSEKESLDSSSSSSELSASVESSPKQSSVEPSEVEKLRQELKSVVQHFETKFDMIFNKLAQLNEQMQSFEVLNKTVWSQVTLSV
ncbi:insulin-like growth factor-binding protein complex acid labile subunit [Drosophila subpulchrella]|uniref:insulin-like growth factor-binding protein complex acid labile subunit n=1 Tax=Drosophila subpulchrella TaxID=1486046 RepID=UPI0018A19ECE|nr:insulin-like growth factor-binding protein complex acid labile subunit [Drosophila subpulchrella]